MLMALIPDHHFKLIKLFHYETAWIHCLDCAVGCHFFL